MSNNKPFDPTKPVVISNPSTGPKTEVGKAASSQNSLRHGCCADTLILKTENPQDFKTLEALWFKAYSPKDNTEIHMVQELVIADWFLQRATRSVAEVEAGLFDAEPNQSNWTEQQQRTMGRFLRYQTTRANNVKRARKTIEEFRKNRAAEKMSDQKLAAATTRLKTFQEKHKPEPSWKEHLENMRLQAISLGYAPDPTTK